jgi:hypothetical protein
MVMKIQVNVFWVVTLFSVVVGFVEDLAASLLHPEDGGGSKVL